MNRQGSLDTRKPKILHYTRNQNKTKKKIIDLGSESKKKGYEIHIDFNVSSISS